MKEEKVSQQEMQIVINCAKSKGFIAIEDDPEWPLEENYTAAVEFEKLTPEQQAELRKLAKDLGL